MLRENSDKPVKHLINFSSTAVAVDDLDAPTAAGGDWLQDPERARVELPLHPECIVLLVYQVADRREDEIPRIP